MLTKCSDNVKKLNRLMEAATLENDGQWHPARGKSIGLALEQAERTVLRLRELYALDYKPDPLPVRQKQLAITQDVLNITIDADDHDAIQFVIPVICTKRQFKDRYLRDTLDQLLEPYFPVPMMLKKRVVVFNYYFPETSAVAHSLVDYDNIETRSILNVLTKYILYDDDPRSCQIHYCSSVGNSRKTAITVFTEGRFKDWLGKAGD